ncbi:hypothetical protein QJS10_CPB11g01353 [Acorus calamus]|uniref:Tyrosinase copper-binding domain-containing protein n=1 Tax=Acorus calamus TaxID=4465 RepID=A0AAV9DSD6_ACOCL|nr:hypothetical protein QJS10_CPB11g01353 [Acorus calamus]
MASSILLKLPSSPNPPTTTPSSRHPLLLRNPLPTPSPRDHHHRRHTVTCKSTNNDDDKTPTFLDRRELLLGLTGAYGASALAPPPSTALPIEAPILADCGAADLPPGASPTNCCPPLKTSDIVDFVTPPPWAPFRLRPAAHLITDKAYLDKFALAISRMKALPDSDPRSFKNQANVHCAYCDGAYDQVGFPDLELQVHNSWLFFPWHRCYLYFFERILGKLIEDDSFAIPFWNWDHPDGMKMPSIYTDPSSSLFDPLRDAKHQPPTLIDLDYNDVDPDYTDKEQIDHNLRIMYRQLVSNARTPELFMGRPYRAGDQPNPGAGSLENIPHGPVHVWTGDRNQPNKENMGTFYAAGRDPIFYAHHANVDRMWDVWKAINKNKHKDFTDKDWLETSFLFYDENKRPVRVRVRDALEPSVMKYGYEQVPLPWLKTKPLVKLGRLTKAARGKKLEEHVEADVAASFPLKLKKAVSVTVKRPKVSRSATEKEEAEEVLVVDGIEFSRDEYVKIDVYVNSAGHEEKVSPGGRELIGSFVSVPHKHKHDKKEKAITTSLRLGLSEFLEETGAEGDESIVVSLVPRKGKSKIKIGGLKIEFAS